MYLMLGRAEPIPRVTTETPAPFSPKGLTRILDPKTREFGFTCRIFTKVKGGHSVGSGVLILPRYVLTCAHVIQPPQNPNFVESITVFVAQNGPADNKHGIKADGWAVKPGWSAHCCRSWDEDYGIIRLSKSATGFWPVIPFDPRRLTGKGAHLAGYPVRSGDPDAHFMYESRGLVDGTIRIDSCTAGHLDRTFWPDVNEATRLVAHRLDTARSMSGGPLWSFIDGQRVLWGLHAGDIDQGLKKGVLLNRLVRGQIGRWVRHELPAR